jgi:group I intron endonuclease
MCYIGQAVDLARRWKDHAKCGLGIDTPASNKLYKAMIEDGLWNFSFEILEECPSAQLNEKEKYYIQLYKSYEFGYNSNKGITK